MVDSAFHEGEKHGKLLLLEKTTLHHGGQRIAAYVCKCDCGKETTVRWYSIKRGTKSCGCARFRSKSAAVGTRYGQLVIVEDLGTANKRHPVRCLCTCGNTVVRNLYDLSRLNKNGKKIVDTCGCGMTTRKNVGLAGTKVDDLYIVDTYIKERARWVVVKCYCGKTFETRWNSVITRATRSCGCLSTEKFQRYSHKPTVQNKTPLKRVWKNMCERCENTTNVAYARYGGRGITVCSEWKDFNVFEKWALSNGYDKHLQLDRIDNDGSYSPENCRFVTPTENARNSSVAKLNMQTARNIRSSFSKGEPISKIADKLKIGKRTVQQVVRFFTWKEDVTLCVHDILFMKYLATKGVTLYLIGAMYHTSHTEVAQHLNSPLWQFVPKEYYS